MYEIMSSFAYMVLLSKSIWTCLQAFFAIMEPKIYYAHPSTANEIESTKELWQNCVVLAYCYTSFMQFILSF